jgi:deoxyribonuclease V
MRIETLHPWPRLPEAAITLQRRLASQLVLRPLPRTVRLIAGVDVAFPTNGETALAGVVVWNLHEQAVVERHVARRPCRFPYVPGLLSFREIPCVVAAMRKLSVSPDVVLCDGQGLAHPRRFGLACHLGLWLGIPTVGCAKSRLCGEHDEPGQRRGCLAPLLLDERPIGAVVRTRDGVRPLYVSPGHRCDIRSAVQITLAAACRYRLPEPTRLAHQLVSHARSRTDGEGSRRPIASAAQ